MRGDGLLLRLLLQQQVELQADLLQADVGLLQLKTKWEDIVSIFEMNTQVKHLHRPPRC